MLKFNATFRPFFGMFPTNPPKTIHIVANPKKTHALDWHAKPIKQAIVIRTEWEQCGCAKSESNFEYSELSVRQTPFFLESLRILNDTLARKKSGGPLSRTASQPTACEESRAMQPDLG